MPNNQKLCNFDCVYCQYSPSESTTSVAFPTLKEIEYETTKFLKDAKKNGRTIDWITIAGNGEPTLHPQFRQVVERLLSLRDQFLPDVQVGILSNSSTCHRPDIVAALDLLDGRFMKLDAGSRAIFKTINRPSGLDGWEDMMRGLRDLKDTVLQSLFFGGSEQNIASSQIAEWIGLVNEIQPRCVHLYTIDRPTQVDGLRRVPLETLNRIARKLTAQTGIVSEVY